MTTAMPTATTPAATTPVRAQATSAPGPRTALDVLLAQLAGIDRCARATVLDLDVELSREQRMDLERLARARDAERETMVACTQRALAGIGAPLLGSVPPRAVLAHRHPWFRDKVRDGLLAAGVTIVAEVEDGAQACGAVLAEQPDILLLEELLPSFTGKDVVRRVRALTPGTCIGVQVHDAGHIGDLMDAGADTVFQRVVPPADVVLELTRHLAVRPRA